MGPYELVRVTPSAFYFWGPVYHFLGSPLVNGMERGSITGILTGAMYLSGRQRDTGEVVAMLHTLQSLHSVQRF